jgi:hypothetical protein
MSVAWSRISDDRQPLAMMATGQETHRAIRWLERATWAFVALGVLLRIARYLMNYPLWWDEAFVAVNFIRRDYLDLLRPLDYGQVCPILFLWAELAIIKLLGFSEWSLRLFPLGCAVGSLFLFRHVASRVVRGLPLLVAVAIFATSFHPILHAADIKPYASDLLAALIVLALAIEWARAPERTVWMWVMAAVAPIMIALSHPVIFIAAGTAAGLAPTVFVARRRIVWFAFGAFCLTSASAFISLFLVFTHAQAAANLSAMQTQWAAAFPPLDDPIALLKWLFTVHTGGMFAYPCGGESGASAVSFVLFLVGAGALWSWGRRSTVLICLAPFGMAIVAASLRRYPYGGPVAHGSPARVMQYLAPTICLLSGLGLAALIARWGDPRIRYRIVRVVLLALAAVGIIPVAADAFHPYRAIHAQRARQFARQFWPSLAHGPDPLCLRWDLGVGEWDSTNLNVAVYLCNQQIYSPGRERPHARNVSTLVGGQPLVCVSPLFDPADPRVGHWLDRMKARYRLKDAEMLAVDMAGPGQRPRIEHYNIYHFVISQPGPATADGGSRITVER